MYLDSLELKNVRTFVKSKLRFLHPDSYFRSQGAQPAGPKDLLLPRPRLQNVNLLLGDNGSGKSTVLRTIALAALGPAVTSAGLSDPGLVRRAPDRPQDTQGQITADLVMHEQDRATERTFVESKLVVHRRGELDVFDFVATDGWHWEPVFESSNDAFFVVGYGATRRVERPESFDMGARTQARFGRGQRVASLFEESFSLIPLSYWLPELEKRNKGRYVQVRHLIDKLLKPGQYRFLGKRDAHGDYLFQRGKLKVPFQALSDGYRAFIGWVADLLYHVCYGCPSGKKLVDNRGIVLVDEIDLHLHPRWQKQVIRTVARALPRMQFIFTSHSPLVVGTLEWMNILALKANLRTNRTVVKRLRQSVHGLDTDQILLSDFFGLKSTVAPAKRKQLERITHRIHTGDKDAPLDLVRQLSAGTEPPE